MKFELKTVSREIPNQLNGNILYPNSLIESLPHLLRKCLGRYVEESHLCSETPTSRNKNTSQKANILWHGHLLKNENVLGINKGLCRIKILHQRLKQRFIEVKRHSYGYFSADMCSLPKSKKSQHDYDICL